MVPVATGATTEACARPRGRCGFDRRTSTIGPAKASEGVVDGPGVVRERARVMTMAAREPRAAWMASTMSPSWFDWKVLDLEAQLGRRRGRPVDVLVERVRAVHVGLALAQQVQVRAVETGARCPVRTIARSGPVRHVVERRCGGVRVDPGHDLDAVGAVEHEGQAVDRLLVPRHEHEQLGRVDARRAARLQPVLGRPPAVLVDPPAVDAPEAVGQLGRVDEADGDRLAVAQVGPPAGLQRVGQGVAVVQRGPARVLARSSRSSAATTSALMRTQAAIARRAASPAGRRRSGSGTWPSRPARSAAPARAAWPALGVAQHRAGCQNAPTRFFPSGRFTPVLPSDGGVDHAEQGRRHVHDRDPRW